MREAKSGTLFSGMRHAALILSVQRYLDAIETADLTKPSGLEAKTARLHVRQQVLDLNHVKEQLEKQPDAQLLLTDPDSVR
ncbi:ISPsy6, transposase [Caballeronia glathei]|nr:hypothetical protein [Caballeronia glathei]CDY79027.1 ISPsy6, transposase [Caballeronia glathei]